MPGGLSSSKCLDRMKSSRFRQKLEMCIFCALILAVWVLLSLPILFFHLPLNQMSETNTNNSNTPTTNHSCSQSSLYLTSENMCYQYLQNVLTDSCQVDTKNQILIVNFDEERLSLLSFGLGLINPSKECRMAVLPFLCQHILGLCDESGNPILPTLGECEEIRDIVCASEWNLAKNFGLELPDCNLLPTEKPACQLSNNNDTFYGESAATTKHLPTPKNAINDAEVKECSHGFYRDNQSQACIPSCYSWTQYEPTRSKIIDVFMAVAVFVGFLSAIAVIIISCLRHRTMFRFPSVLIVYIVIDAIAIQFCIITIYMDRPGLICSSESFFENKQKVTPFCIISGIIFEYGIIQITTWWLAHIVVIFLQVVFPLQSRSLMASRRVKYFHLTCIIIGILFPLLPVVTSMIKFGIDIREKAGNGTSVHQLFISGGLGYSSSRSPTILCRGSNQDAVFYGFLLPFDLILAIGCTLLLVIFYSIHRQNMKIKVKNTSNQINFGTAEKKLLVVVCYYLVMATLYLTVATLAIRNRSKFIQGIQKYFLCEQGGHNSSSPCSRDYEWYSYPILATLSYVVLCFFPTVKLVYAVNIKEIKEAFKKFKLKKKAMHFDYYTNSTGSSIPMTSTKKANS